MASGIGLGDRVKDRISVYQGIVIARTEWLNKCVRMTVQSEDLKDGKPVESQTFDQTDLVLVTADVFGEHAPKRERVPTGGPPARGSDPRR